MKNEKKATFPKILIMLQILLAACYMFFSWDARAIHMEKGMYMQAADTMCFDEYTGVLYPVFLRFVNSMFSGEKAFNTAILLIQLLAVLVASVVFLKKLEKTGVWAVLYLITFPLCMQSFMAITPVAFEIAVLLVFFGAFFKMDRNIVDYVLMIISLIAGILLSKEIFICMLIALIIGVIVSGLLRRVVAVVDKASIIKSVVTIVIGTVIAGVLYGGLTSKGAYNRMPGTIETGFMCNVAAEHLEEDYYFWPDDVKEAVPFEELSDIVKSREYAVTELGKLLSEKLSYDQMRKAAFGIGKASAFNRSKETINLVVANFFDYFAFPVTIVSNMYGKGKSISDVYFMMYKGKSGFISRTYLIGGLVILLLMLAINADKLMGKKEKALKAHVYAGTILLWLLFNIYVSFVSFNYFDYFRVLPFVALIVLEMGAVVFTEKLEPAKEDDGQDEKAVDKSDKATEVVKKKSYAERIAEMKDKDL